LESANTQENAAQVLTRDWYVKLEESAATNFINLPLEFQIRGYDYSFISKTYLTFFNSDDNTRQDKLILAKKFLKFIRSINKNRAKEECGEDFFMCLNYFLENFPDLLSKQDSIALETLSVITDAIDRTAFVEDIISVDELKRRVEALEVVQKQEEIIEAEFCDSFLEEYNALNENRAEKERPFLLKEAKNLNNLDNLDNPFPSEEEEAAKIKLLANREE
jgi:hypothetical protein